MREQEQEQEFEAGSSKFEVRTSNFGVNLAVERSTFEVRKLKSKLEVRSSSFGIVSSKFEVRGSNFER